jgi:hypothetical protein
VREQKAWAEEVLAVVVHVSLWISWFSVEAFAKQEEQ